jgi:hypothetical protein
MLNKSLPPHMATSALSIVAMVFTTVTKALSIEVDTQRFLPICPRLADDPL